MTAAFRLKGFVQVRRTGNPMHVSIFPRAVVDSVIVYSSTGRESNSTKEAFINFAACRRDEGYERGRTSKLALRMKKIREEEDLFTAP